MILLIDNYDSFVQNLARYLRRLGHETLVIRNDAVDVAGVAARAPKAIVLSPGPCTPSEAGCSLEIVRKLHRDIPILGICLGHQTIAAAFGSRVVRSVPPPIHGRTSEVLHDRQGVFKQLPSPLIACRYHSLVVDPTSLPTALEVTAWTGDRQVMAIRHEELPLIGLQFHPESILTQHGYMMLANFLRLAGLDVNVTPTLNDELRVGNENDIALPDGPVTF